MNILGWSAPIIQKIVSMEYSDNVVCLYLPKSIGMSDCLIFGIFDFNFSYYILQNLLISSHYCHTEFFFSGHFPPPLPHANHIEKEEEKNEMEKEETKVISFSTKYTWEFLKGNYIVNDLVVRLLNICKNDL